MNAFPLRGIFHFDLLTGGATWKGKWAKNMNDMTKKDNRKKSPFEYVGKPATSTISPSTPMVSGVAFPNQWSGFMKVQNRQGLQKRINEKFQTINFVPVHCSKDYSGKLSTTTDHNQPPPLEFKVTIHGDNRLGQFVMEGTLKINSDTLTGPMNCTKIYVK
jgi:hypothetical protein